MLWNLTRFSSDTLDKNQLWWTFTKSTAIEAIVAAIAGQHINLAVARSVDIL